MVDQDKVTELQKELEGIKQKYQQQQEVLIEAQQKRSGHYANLVYQLDQNKKLQKRIEDLEAILDQKNYFFLNELILEKYQNINNDVDIIKKLNQEILANTKLEHSNNKLKNNFDTLESKFAELESRFFSLQAEAKVAQEKRAGHYSKLVAALERNAELEAKISKLQQQLSNSKQSLTWLLGSELLKCKNPLRILSLPYGFYSAYQKFKSYQQAKHQSISLIKDTADSTNFVAQNIAVTASSSVVDISILGWPAPSTDQPITIMSIADEFTTSNLKSVANLITPRPDNWRGLLNRDNPALLFVESAWNGNKNSWQYRVGSYANPPGKELFDVIAEFKKQGIPTVFWNKEDPVHFDKFKNAAKEFDFIFTSDEGSIPAYQKISKAKVLTLPFAADSNINNPIGSTQRQNKVCFGGSYYANRFVERRNDQLMLLESALPYGLDIYDRNAGNANKDFHFPEQFKDCIKGALPYDKMNQAYKQYKVFLNVNSVIDSKTMFSRRVFELLASGTPVVSTQSLGIDEFFGRDLVWTVKNKEEAQEAIHTLLNDDKEWRRRSLLGIRNVFLNHTFKERFQFILQEVGLAESLTNLPKILCCVEANLSEDLEHFHAVFNSQNTMNKFEMMPLVILRNSKLRTDLPAITDKSTAINQLLGQYLKQNRSIEFVTFFANSNVYGKNYLLDLYLATLYAEASIISKPEIDSYEYAHNYFPASSLFKRNVFEDNSVINNFSLLPKSAIDSSIPVFMGDSANFAKQVGRTDKLLMQIEI